MNKFDRYHNAICFLEGLSNLPLETDYMSAKRQTHTYLQRMRYFLDLIGNPDRGLKFIHIAGTSGKGSVTAMVHEILHAAGRNVGSFTSPFVTTSIEKIKVKDKYIAPEELADIVEYLKPFIDEAYLKGPYGRPSYFEIFLAIAFVYFKRQKCDWVVLEVGLGGTYDATNVIERPAITAITNIDYDHMDVLGRTLQQIAANKAGIIKKGSKFFTAETRPQLVRMFQAICKAKKVPFHQIPRRQDYKQYNQALATAIAQSLGIGAAAIRKGLQKSRLPCRFELMQNKPQVVLDGAHNRAKVRSTIANLQNLRFKKLHLILGMADNKDSAAILEQVVPLANHVYLTRFQIRERKCAHPKILLQKSKKYLRGGAKAEIFLDPERALAQALKNARPEDLVLVVGSFFLGGELRKKWFTEEWVLENRKSFR